MFPNPSLIAQGSDDQRLFVSRRDLSGGVNTAMHPQHIGENQATVLENADISINGQRSKRMGINQVANDVGNSACKSALNYTIQGGTDQIIMAESTHLWRWEGTGSFASVGSLASVFVDTSDIALFSIKERSESPDDVFIVQNGTNNPYRFTSVGASQDLGNTAGTASDSPPKSLVNAWYANRWWILKSEQLYFSDAYDDDYSSSFDTVSNWYRIPVGQEMALVPTRDMGIIVMGNKEIWALNPSAVPAATDKPVPIITNEGCVARRTAITVADDVYWLAQSGVRALKRTEQDKLQMHSSLPISFPNKAEYDLINWTYVSKASAVYYDNKYLIALPTSSATYNNKVWVYYPATNGWSTITGWNVADWVKYKVSGKENLYYVDSTDGKMYQAFTGYDDEGSYIAYTEEGREEDFGQPLVNKFGGTIEVEAVASGGIYTISVYASVDGGAYKKLGDVNIYSETAATLPVTLPFTLGGDTLERAKFHLDPLGSFRTLKIKMTNNDLNSDFIKIIGHNITTYAEEYQDE